MVLALAGRRVLRAPLGFYDILSVYKETSMDRLCRAPWKLWLQTPRRLRDAALRAQIYVLKDTKRQIKGLRQNTKELSRPTKHDFLRQLKGAFYYNAVLSLTLQQL